VALDLVLLGPPGSGKGTQAAMLSQKYRIPAISTGDVLRAQVEAGLGQRVKAYLDRGELVPDSLVVDLIQHRLSDPDTQQGFILDGFPRTVPQAQALDSMLAALDRPLDAVLYLQVDPHAVRERLGQRHRGDDLQGVIDHRLDVFLQQTAPLISYYQDQGKLKVIDGAQPPEVVAAGIEDVIRPLAGPSFGIASFGHKPNVSQVVPDENTKENGSNA
jgi:adenylate kinase